MQARRGALLCFVALFFLLVAPLAGAALEPAIGLNNNFGADPSTCRNFAWQSEPEAAYALLQYQLWDDPQENAPETAVAETYFIETDDGRRASHRVALTGLEPAAKYRYRVVMPTIDYYSRYYSFETMGPDEEEISFLHMTDSQCSTFARYIQYWGYTLDRAVESYPDVDFLLHTGDMVDRPDLEADHWNGFFEAAQEHFPRYPLLTLIGNHEYAWEGTPFVLAHFAYDESSAIPMTYSQVYGDMLLLCLNTSEDPEALARWARQELDEKGGDKWLVVAMHIGLYSGEHHYDSISERLRNALLPIFDEFGVHLVLQGHDHIYMRSHLMKNGQPVPSADDSRLDARRGTLYMIPFTAGTKTYADTLMPWMYKAWLPEELSDLSKRVYSHITVRSDEMEITVHTVDGGVLDHFVMTK